MAVEVTFSGLPLDDAASDRRRHSFAVTCARPLVKPDVLEFDDLVGSWRSVGFHGGFGGWLHSISPIRHQPRGDGWSIDFQVDGTVTHLALAVLLRCLDVSDIDVIFETLHLDVQAL